MKIKKFIGISLLLALACGCSSAAENAATVKDAPAVGWSLDLYPQPFAVGVDQIALSPDGKTAALASAYGGRAVLVDLASGQARAVESSYGRPDGLAFSPDGTYLSVKQFDEGVALYTVADGKLAAKIPDGSLHRDQRFSPDGRYLVYATRDYVSATQRTYVDVVVLTVPDFQVARKLSFWGTLQGNGSGCGSDEVAFSDDSRLLRAQCLADRRGYRIDTGELAALPDGVGYSDPAYDLAYDSAVGASSIVRTSDRAVVRTFPFYLSLFDAPGNGGTMIAKLKNADVVMFDNAAGTERLHLKWPDDVRAVVGGEAAAARLLPDGKRILFGTTDGRARLVTLPD